MIGSALIWIWDALAGGVVSADVAPCRYNYSSAFGFGKTQICNTLDLKPLLKYQPTFPQSSRNAHKTKFASAGGLYISNTINPAPVLVVFIVIVDENSALKPACFRESVISIPNATASRSLWNELTIIERNPLFSASCKSRFALWLTLLSLIFSFNFNTAASNTRLLDRSPSTCKESCALVVPIFAASNFASAASFPACLASRFEAADFSVKSAISKPEMMLIPSAATTSTMMPAIKIRQPRSISLLYASTISPKMSGLKSAGGINFSAFFSIANPQATITPPDKLRIISAQNQNDETNIKTKFIYVLLISVPHLILLATFIALLFRHHRRKRNNFCNFQNACNFPIVLGA